MRKSSARTASCWALLALVVALTACGTGAQEAAPRPSPSATRADLEVSVEYPRYLQVQRQVEIVVINRGSAPITVRRLQLLAPQFSPTPPVAKDTRIEPGRRVDLKTDFGAVNCHVRADAPTAAEVRTRNKDGETVTGRFRLPTDPLGRIHRTECGQARVARAVGLTFADTWERTPAGMQVDLQISRKSSSQPIRIIGVAGSVIFTMRPLGVDAEPVVTLDPSRSAAASPVEFVASRCDPHAVIESKKTYWFTVWVQLGTADEQAVIVMPQPELRAALERLIDECMAAEQD